MNKSELIDAIASHADLNKAQAGAALDGMISAITDELSNGGSLTLVGFGTFSVKERAARTGRNPKTREPLEIPASKVPSFKAGKTLKDSVSGNGNSGNKSAGKSTAAKAPAAKKAAPAAAAAKKTK